MGKADFIVENHGSVVLIRPLKKKVEKWLRQNVGGEAQYFGNALAVEPRYFEDLFNGMTDEGFIPEGAN